MGTPRPRRQPIRIPANAACLLLVLPLAGSCLHAQTLPEAPSAPCPRTVTGTVVDTEGDEIPFAKVSLSRTASSSLFQQVTVGEDGIFTLPGTPDGPCTLRVAADGFLTRSLPVTAADITVQLVASDSADVTVTSTQEEIAEAEIQLEEHQMIAGFVPNFYVAYDFHSASLNKRQKFQLAYKTLINPYTNLINAGIAGLEQADNALPGYHQGAAGYARRFAAQTADTTIGTMLAGVVLPIAFRQDPRYFYMGHGTVMHRALYALSTAVVARGDNGKWQPAYAGILGEFGSGALSNLYYPKSDRSDGVVTLYNGLISVGMDGIGNLVQEFVFKHLTPHAPVTP